MYEKKAAVIQRTNPMMASTLCSRTGTNFFPKKTARQGRFASTNNFTGGKFLVFNSIDLNPDETDLKPRLLESKVITQKNFFNLSNGFQRVFANDEKDQKLNIPIAGYSGHQRGDIAQNYFGKTFRDSAMDAKKLQRSAK
mmetsp:Transcript_20164/g.17865  ORF Transcript_20164/g.17865 Transcript_20164/m.17865 type:complete len:140 (+) Transcript_20164:573-992(+)